MVKPDDVTLVIVPVDPPSAGPDRAFDPPLPPAPGNPCPAAAGAEVDADVGVDVGDWEAAAHPVRPTAVAEKTAIVIHAFLLLSSERTLVRRARFDRLFFMISLLLLRKSL
jgi:hypothetical protein